MANVIDGIAQNPKPGDTASWWEKQQPLMMSGNLEQEESEYLQFFTSSEVDPVLRVGRGIANAGNLSPEQRERAKKLFGDAPVAISQFVNWENRRRIIAHYVWTHPATVAYELQLYRTTRDVVPLLFVTERVYEVATGEEAFTGDKVSRLRAGVDLLIAIVVGRVFKAAAGAAAGARVPTRPLTEPIWDLPPEGGGMNINGRYYTEHALERMAPDTPQIRAEMKTRIIKRLDRLGLKQGSKGFDAVFDYQLGKIDPRGVPPSVVEAEISRPGSTDYDVITVRRKQVVVTVKPKKLPKVKK